MQMTFGSGQGGTWPRPADGRVGKPGFLDEGRDGAAVRTTVVLREYVDLGAPMPDRITDSASSCHPATGSRSHNPHFGQVGPCAHERFMAMSPAIPEKQ